MDSIKYVIVGCKLRFGFLSLRGILCRGKAIESAVRGGDLIGGVCRLHSSTASTVLLPWGHPNSDQGRPWLVAQHLERLYKLDFSSSRIIPEDKRKEKKYLYLDLNISGEILCRCCVVCFAQTLLRRESGKMYEGGAGKRARGERRRGARLATTAPSLGVLRAGAPAVSLPSYLY